MSLTDTQIKRYARHLVLKDIGGPGQNALLGARVAIIGAGGLGGPATLYLAAAGVGHLTIMDDDTVELSNLQRQIQFGQSDIGIAKTHATSQRIHALNEDIEVTCIDTKLSAENAKDILRGHDVVLDGTDDFATRFAVNAASYDLQIPLVSGALGQFDGQLSVFNADANSPCYRCWVPEVPPQAESCATLGVVGALAGVIGSMMAMETIKIITRAGQPLTGRLLIYDGLAATTRTLMLARDPACPTCARRG